MSDRETFDVLVRRLTPNETWEDFAERCGVSARMLQNYRYGRSKRPHRLTLAAIADALSVDVAVVRRAIEASREDAGG